MLYIYLIKLTFFLLPLSSMSILGLLSSNNVRLMRLSSLIFSLINLNLSFILWFLLVKNQTIIRFQFFIFDVLFDYSYDSISASFLVLTSFLTTVTLLISWNWLPKFFSVRFYLFLIIIIQFISFNFFTTNNLFHFYIFFESVLIPMYLLLGIWGLRPRKIHAAYQFFLYTFIGSLFMLIAIIYLKTFVHSNLPLNINLLGVYLQTFSDLEQKLIWLCFFIAFAVKVPMIPVHIWLPEAHVEAPTAGSVILAGLLLKYGTFGFYKILVINMYSLTNYYFWLIVILSLISIIYGSVITYIQVDFKKIIAYSSVSHMGYVTLGLAIKTPESLVGSLLMMLTHGFISSALFYIVGILYERYGTRNIYDYGGLKNVMPLFTLYFFLLTLANLNLPLTAGFIAEFLVLISLGKLTSKIVLLVAALGVFTNGVYAIWLFNRVCFGKNIFSKNHKMHYIDLDRRENFILFIFIFIIFLIGIAPSFFLIALEPINIAFLTINASNI